MPRTSKILVILAFAAGILLTSWGLVHLPWPHALPWADAASLQRFLMFLSVSMLLISLGALWSKKNPLFIGGILAFCIALLTGHIWPVMVVLWFMVASYSLGNMFLGWILSGVEDSWLMSCLVGIGIYGTVVGLLAHFPVNYVGVYSFLLVLPLIINWRKLIVKIKGLFSIVFTNNPRSGIKSVIIKLDIVIAAIGLIYFVVALMPELGYDALAMHLFVPTQLKLRHEWGFDASLYVFSVMPMLGEWIYSVGYMLAGETASRLIDISFIFIICGLVRELVLWAHGSNFGSRLAILIFLSTPLIVAEGATLDIDTIWTAFLVAGSVAIFKSCSISKTVNFSLPIAGLLLGAAFAAKAVTFSIFPILVIVLFIRYKAWYKTIGLKSLLLGICLFLVFGTVPYITAWLLTNNPIFPFYNTIFHSIYFPTSSNFNTTAIVYSQGISWDLLYKGTFQAGKYLEASAGAPGFQWLLLFVSSIIFLFLKKQRRGLLLLLIGALIIVAVFHNVSYFRYALPAWPLVVAGMGVVLSLCTTTKKLIKYIAYIVVTFIIVLNLLFWGAAMPGAIYQNFPLNSILSLSNRDAYILSRGGMSKIIAVTNYMNMDHSPVAFFAAPQATGLVADALYPNWYNWRFELEVAAVKSKIGMVNLLRKHKVSFVVLDSHWNGVNCCGDGAKKQAFLEGATQKIYSYDGFSLRKVTAQS